MTFNPDDPFPYAQGLSLAEAQEHARAADAWLELDVDKTESAISMIHRAREMTGSFYRDAATPVNAWIGLSPQSLLTPYTELREVLEILRPKAGETLVDLGAGYGRLAFVVALHFPETRFVGYELIEERVREGRRALEAWIRKQHWKWESPPKLELQNANIAEPGFTPLAAEYYFIYDYGSREAIEKTLEDLRHLAQRKPITVIGRGRLVRDCIERGQPWLAQVVPPAHHGNFTLYRSG